MFTTLTIQLNNIWAEDCIILRPIARVCRKSALYYNKYSLGQILPLIYTTKSSYSGNIKRWHIIYFSLFMYYKIIISHGVTCKVNFTWPLQMKTTTDWVYIIFFPFCWFGESWLYILWSMFKSQNYSLLKNLPVTDRPCDWV